MKREPMSNYDPQRTQILALEDELATLHTLYESAQAEIKELRDELSSLAATSADIGGKSRGTNSDSD